MRWLLPSITSLAVIATMAAASGDSTVHGTDPRGDDEGAFPGCNDLAVDILGFSVTMTDGELRWNIDVVDPDVHVACVGLAVDPVAAAYPFADENVLDRGVILDLDDDSHPLQSIILREFDGTNGIFDGVTFFPHRDPIWFLEDPPQNGEILSGRAPLVGVAIGPGPAFERHPFDLRGMSFHALAYVVDYGSVGPWSYEATDFTEWFPFAT